MNNLIIVGAGGHAKVVLSVAIANSIEVQGYIDDDISLLNKIILDYPVIGTLSLLNLSVKAAVMGLGSNALRSAIAKKHASIEWKTLIHPTATVHSSAKLGKGTVVFAGAIIQPNSVIGDHCIINTSATVDHDCVLGDYVHVSPGVHLAGGVCIGEGSFLGIGSVVIPEVIIGEWVQVAAGSVVVTNISDKKIVMGVPAKERVI